ncbi:MAG: DUF6526 family protein [Vicingaceae bacterium]|nr:DUF6526 family protein [Vicingaceae bacterium]
MSTQNFKNHSRLIFGFHGFTALAILALIAGSVFNLLHSDSGNLYSASLLLLISIVSLFLWFYTRAFSLKAQDRAIRAEESLRYFQLTQKRMSSNLKMRQIIGLRFAADEEFVELALRAEKENLSEKDIKIAIKNWKPDTYRV